MRQSINKIFSNLGVVLMGLTLCMGFILVGVLEEKNPYSQIKNLQTQKQIIEILVNLTKDNSGLTLIKLNSKSTELRNKADELRQLNKYDYIGNLVLNIKREFLSDLDKLSVLITKFNESTSQYYVNDNVTTKDNEKLLNAFNDINKFLDLMIVKNISYLEQKFNIRQYITLFSFLIILVATLWYKRRLNSIYLDISYLFAINENKKDYNFFSEEASAIQLRIGRKSSSLNNKNMLDPVTKINNYDGMINDYNNKKNVKNINFVSVTVFEIDNFSKQNRVFQQEFTQTILKKVAFNISLYEQATDIIARTDYNQFTIILSRDSKEQSFKDADIIRQSISEINFVEPSKGKVTITLSGGFIIIPNNKHLSDSIKEAKKLLLYAQKTGKNFIAQTKDLIKNN